MTHFIKKHMIKVGAAPGSLTQRGTLSKEKVSINLTQYDALGFSEREDVSLEECLKAIKSSEKTTWIHINGIHDPKIIEELGALFQIHSLFLEDIITTTQRPKFDEFPSHLFIVQRILSINDHHEITDDQISLIFGQGFLISFVERPTTLFKPIEERIHKEGSKIRKMGADYLAYSLIDCIVDTYFLILEKVDEDLEVLEAELLHTPSPVTIQKIQNSKRTLSFLRKNVWPLREVINNFRKTDSAFVADQTKFYLQDVYDHTIQAIDTIESFRDIAAGMLDIYLSNINQRMNEIMKVLTIVSTLFVPLTFIASIYGMNFTYMPELNWHYGYHITLGIMAIVALNMLFYFRRKKWL